MTLRPSVWKTVALLAACIGFVAIGIAAVRRDAPFIGWLNIVFFGLGVAISAIQLIPGASFLRLDADGFVLRSLFRETRYAWRDVGPFYVAAVPPSNKKMVVFDAPGVETKLYRINRALVGASHGLPDTYGMKPSELALLLNAFRAHSS